MLSFGNCHEAKTVNHTKIEETEQIEPEPQSSSQIQTPTKDVDSIQETSPKTPKHEELIPIKSESESHQKPEEPSKESVKDGKTAKDEKVKDSPSDLNAAVKYLDSHYVWKMKEMENYPDLKNLNKLIIESIHSGHSILPRELCHNSKKLNRIDNLLREFDQVNIKKASKLFKRVKIEFDGHPVMISPQKVVVNIKDAIKRKHNLKREIEAYDKLVQDEAKKSEPTFELR